MQLIEHPPSREEDRTPAFADFARRRAHGEVVIPPLMPSQTERRLHVWATLRGDHPFRFQNRPEGAQAKFDKLASSAWQFFRGSALLFYRDIAGTDAQQPCTLDGGASLLEDESSHEAHRPAINERAPFDVELPAT